MVHEITKLEVIRKVQPDAAFAQLASDSASARELLTTKLSALDAASIDTEYITVKANADASGRSYDRILKEYQEEFSEVPEEDKLAAAADLGGRAAARSDVVAAQSVRDKVIEKKGQAKTTKDTAYLFHTDLKKKHRGMNVTTFTGEYAACLERETFCNSEIVRLRALVVTTSETIAEQKLAIEHCRGELKNISSLADTVDLERTPGGLPFAGLDESNTALSASVKWRPGEALKTVLDELREKGLVEFPKSPQLWDKGALPHLPGWVNKPRPVKQVIDVTGVIWSPELDFSC